MAAKDLPHLEHSRTRMSCSAGRYRTSDPVSRHGLRYHAYFSVPMLVGRGAY